jgi:RNase P/RNase MRP subunit p30
MAEVELAKKSLSFLEIEIAQILLLEGTARIRLISIINKEAHIAEHFHIPFILSSGATNALLLRKPRDVASLATLFDIDVTLALRAISEIPIYLVNRNRLKLKPEFVAPGISLIERRTQDV